eukprot:3100158-Pleurochrysis_carterae.AAC.1
MANLSSFSVAHGPLSPLPTPLNRIQTHAALSSLHVRPLRDLRRSPSAQEATSAEGVAQSENDNFDQFVKTLPGVAGADADYDAQAATRHARAVQTFSPALLRAVQRVQTRALTRSGRRLHVNPPPPPPFCMLAPTLVDIAPPEHMPDEPAEATLARALPTSVSPTHRDVTLCASGALFDAQAARHEHWERVTRGRAVLILLALQ